jgi:hypothetical protein
MYIYQQVQSCQLRALFARARVSYFCHFEGFCRGSKTVTTDLPGSTPCTQCKDEQIYRPALSRAGTL